MATERGSGRGKDVLLDNVEPGRVESAAPGPMGDASDEGWRQAVADDFSRSWQQADAAADEPAPAQSAAAAPVEAGQRDNGGGHEQDASGWGRPVRPAADEWGWPESPPAQPSGAGRWAPSDASATNGSRSNGSSANGTGWSDYADQASWAAAQPQAANDSEGVLPDITLFTREERVRCPLAHLSLEITGLNYNVYPCRLQHRGSTLGHVRGETQGQTAVTTSRCRCDKAARRRNVMRRRQYFWVLTPHRCCPVQDKLLPLSPFKEQVEFFRGDLTQNLRRLGGAVLVTVLASTKAALLSAGALTFPFWWPWLMAAKKNNDVKSQYPCARGAPPLSTLLHGGACEETMERLHCHVKGDLRAC